MSRFDYCNTVGCTVGVEWGLGATKLRYTHERCASQQRRRWHYMGGGVGHKIWHTQF
jgi:hypothetical protein